MTQEHWRQIEDLYHAARERDPVARAALLECTDPEVRARVERMLEIESGDAILDPKIVLTLADRSQTVLAAGAQLGPYRIEAQIGKGGMGTVYRAVDTRLGRVVAIKVAAERYSERFQLEARAISTLNHPHICTLYDVGPNYLVMEFLDGPTLATELKNGPLPAETTVRYGAQMAGALAEAHGLGIVHRDLKPSNIIVTRHGVKVLDFGLAKILSAEDITDGITDTNAIMGTPAYMAPEQLEGRDPTAATDLYALGRVLQEMCAGGRGVKGLSGLIAQLMDRLPEGRPASAAAVRDRLNSLAAPQPRTLVPQLVGVVCLAAVAVAGSWWAATHFAQPPHAFRANGITRLASLSGEESDSAFSPDGRSVAFAWNGERGDNLDIYVMPVEVPTPRRLTRDPARDMSPAWSPDGRQIAFLRLNTVLEGSLVVVPSQGGAERVIREVALREDVYRAMRPLLAWTPDGRGIVYTTIDQETGRAGLYLADLQGTATCELLSASEGTLAVTSPALTRDGKWIAYTEVFGPFQSWLLVRPISAGFHLGGNPIHIPGPDGRVTASPVWSPNGQSLLYLEDSKIVQWNRGERAEQIYVSAGNLRGMSAIWGSGQTVRVATAAAPLLDLYTVPLEPGGLAASGDPSVLGASGSTRGTPEYSHDGSKIVYVSDQSGAREVWVADADGRNPRQLTHLNSTMIGYPRWSNDSQRIVFHSWVGNRPQIFTADLARHEAGSSGGERALIRQVTNAAFGGVTPSWSADGKYIYASRIVGATRMFRIPAQGGPMEDLFEASGGIVSPDGHRILYFKQDRRGIFSRSLDGDPAANPEIKLVDDYRAPGADLNPFDDGVYYISWNGDTLRRTIRFYNYASKKSVDVFVLPGPIASPQALTVSPDRRRLAYQQFSRTGTDLSLIDFQQ